MIPKSITPRRYDDDRGWFMESYSKRSLGEYGIETEFVQDNHSYSAERGTIRGIHFQSPPNAQAKLVRCIVGAVWDVVVDLRSGSPTFGKWAAIELTASGGEQIFMPVGFGHGFVTLTPQAEVNYKASAYYAPESEGGIAWDDPELQIDWPLHGSQPRISPKDAQLPRLTTFQSPFVYDGEPLKPL
jgi:dTDP-4-dehydrorhamnose 3,5-epimerase